MSETTVILSKKNIDLIGKALTHYGLNLKWKASKTNDEQIADALKVVSQECYDLRVFFINVSKLNFEDDNQEGDKQ